MFSGTIREILEAELETEPGYPKDGGKAEGSVNRRNGHSSKKVRSEYGEPEIEIPRDKKGEFEPVGDALLKMLYLMTQDAMPKWTGRIHNWEQSLLQLSVFLPKIGRASCRERV